MFYKKKSFYIISVLFGLSLATFLVLNAISHLSAAESDNLADQETTNVNTSVVIDEEKEEVEYYDKTIYDTEIVKYSDVIIPFTDAVNPNYLDKTVFVGDSNTEGLGSFEHLPLSNVLGKHSMDIQGVTDNAYIQIAEDNPETEEDESQYINTIQALAIKQPKRIIINFGTNNAGAHASPAQFKSVYSQTLQQIKAVCPNTQIVVAAVLPVAQERSYPKILMSVIDEFNLALAQLCREEGYGFLLYPEVFKDSETGFMNTSYISKDGVHLNGDGYRLLLDYANKHQYN